jgi:hypothetical protein
MHILKALQQANRQAPTNEPGLQQLVSVLQPLVLLLAVLLQFLLHFACSYTQQAN